MLWLKYIFNRPGKLKTQRKELNSNKCQYQIPDKTTSLLVLPNLSVFKNPLFQ